MASASGRAHASGRRLHFDSAASEKPSAARAAVSCRLVLSIEAEVTMEGRISVARRIPYAPAAAKPGASTGRHSAAILIAACSIALGTVSATADEDGGRRSGATATPIKHVIVILAEN